MKSKHSTVNTPEEGGGGSRTEGEGRSRRGRGGRGIFVILRLGKKKI